jgi:hypothetical protein
MGQRASRESRRVAVAAPKRHRQQQDGADAQQAQDALDPVGWLAGAPAEQRQPRQRQASRCAICLGQMADPAANTTLSCRGRHAFHTQCWDEARRFNSANPTCPMCRDPVRQARAPALELWPDRSADQDTAWAAAHVRADDDPAVGAAIRLLEPAALSRLLVILERNPSIVPVPTYEVVEAILRDARVPSADILSQYRRWFVESDRADRAMLAYDLGRGRGVGEMRLGPAASELAEYLLAPLTPAVLARIREALGRALREHT